MKLSISNGFTLVEAMATITIISGLYFFVVPRIAIFQETLVKPKVTLVNSLTIARQVAMFSAKNDESIEFILKNNAIMITKNGEDIKSLGIHYPDMITAEVSHDPDVIFLAFNSLGEVQPVVITLTSIKKSDSIRIHSTGYIE